MKASTLLFIGIVLTSGAIGTAIMRDAARRPPVEEKGPWTEYQAKPDAPAVQRPAHGSGLFDDVLYPDGKPAEEHRVTQAQMDQANANNAAQWQRYEAEQKALMDRQQAANDGIQRQYDMEDAVSDELDKRGY